MPQELGTLSRGKKIVCLREAATNVVKLYFEKNDG